MPNEHKQKSNGINAGIKHTPNMHSSNHMFIIIPYTIVIIAEIDWQHLSFDEEFNRNQLRRCNVPPNHRPACSLISQQHCHPRAGHDSFRIRVNCRLAHSQRGHQTAKPTPLGLSGHQQIGQASTVRRPTTAYQQKNHPSQPCEEAKMTRDNPNKR